MNFKNVDTIRVNSGKIHLHLLVYSGKEEDHFVMVSPSLMVSGYGSSFEEARDSFELNVKLYVSEFAALSLKAKESELLKLGFRQEALHHKNYSKSYIDANGVLKDFEAGSFQAQILEESYAA